jgi:hypothetical protein
MDVRYGRLTSNKLSKKSFCSNSFRHLQIDEASDTVWRSDAPLKYKIFYWLARKKSLPTNGRRLKIHLNPTDACLSSNQEEDTDHLLLLCPQAHEVWSFFHAMTSLPGATLASRTCGARNARATRKPPSPPPFFGRFDKREMPGPSMALLKT